jgi:hypothetical protein
VEAWVVHQQLVNRFARLFVDVHGDALGGGWSPIEWIDA